MVEAQAVMTQSHLVHDPGVGARFLVFEPVLLKRIVSLGLPVIIGMLTQTAIIYIIRTNKIPFLQSLPSWPLMVMSSVIMAIGIAIPFTPVGDYLGFTQLPGLYWPLLALSMLCYVVLTQLVKMWLLHQKWI